jgi:ribosomal protein L32
MKTTKAEKKKSSPSKKKQRLSKIGSNDVTTTQTNASIRKEPTSGNFLTEVNKTQVCFGNNESFANEGISRPVVIKPQEETKMS